MSQAIELNEDIILKIEKSQITRKEIGNLARLFSRCSKIETFRVEEIKRVDVIKKPLRDVIIDQFEIGKSFSHSQCIDIIEFCRIHSVKTLQLESMDFIDKSINKRSEFCNIPTVKIFKMHIFIMNSIPTQINFLHML